MGVINLFATILFFACVLTWVKAYEDCITYDGNGICVPPCPNGTIFVSSDCTRPLMSRRSCRRPTSRYLGMRCDYIRCDCDRPKVYDEALDKCVLFKDCSDQSNVTSDFYV